jgi:hypothetical protein
MDFFTPEHSKFTRSTPLAGAQLMVPADVATARLSFMQVRYCNFHFSLVVLSLRAVRP